MEYNVSNVSPLSSQSWTIEPVQKEEALPSSTIKNRALLLNPVIHLNVGKYLSFNDNASLIQVMERVEEIFKSKGYNKDPIPHAGGRLSQICPHIQTSEYLQEELSTLAAKNPYHPFIYHLRHFYDPTPSWDVNSLKYVSKTAPQLECMSIRLTNVTDELLMALKSCKNLKQLSLVIHKDVALNEQLFTELETSLENLRKLHLKCDNMNGGIRSIQEDIIKNIPKTLTDLTLEGARIQGDSLKQLQCLPQLTHLNLSGCELVDVHGDIFLGFPSLIILQLRDATLKMTSETLSLPPSLNEVDIVKLNQERFFGLSLFPNISAISLTSSSGFAGTCKFLQNFQSLRSLTLSCYKFVPMGNEVSFLPVSLEEIEIRDGCPSYSEEFFKGLSKFIHLKKLHLYRFGGNKSSSWLSSLPKGIKMLSLETNFSFNGVLKEIQKLDQLTHLSLKSTYDSGGSYITYENLNQETSDLPKNIQSLELIDESLVFHKEFFDKLENLPYLTSLKLKGKVENFCGIPKSVQELCLEGFDSWSMREIFEKLQNYPQLQTLSLCSRYGCSTVKGFKNLPESIKNLTIYNSTIDEKTNTFLKSLPHIQELRLQNIRLI